MYITIKSQKKNTSEIMKIKSKDNGTTFKLKKIYIIISMLIKRC